MDLCSTQKCNSGSDMEAVASEENLEKVLLECTELLCRRQFEQCMTLSSKLISKLRRTDSVQNGRYSEMLGLLQVQALSELGLVSSLVSALSELFGDWHHCPTKVAVACVAAHAHSNNKPAAQALAFTWLQRNWSVTAGEMMGKVYQRWLTEDAQSICSLEEWLTSLSNVPPGQRTQVVRAIEASLLTKIRSQDSEEARVLPAAAARDSQLSPSVQDSLDGVVHKILAPVLRLLNALRPWLWRARHLLLALALAATLLVQYASLNESSVREQLVRVLEMLRQGWRLAFAPYYQLRTQT